ncbi:hypothetical protein M8C21_022804 [Ambrosia artemisiifolia]|uniref:LRAT domain-containing protein n=1 Tax=Ambrosia artemisiifolia TaxID=4212 RepID=A0AAD5GS87_AMBAR|nr:hypothetical protein M8C21_022804 [Ambrosia artemisiifolia]
MNSNLEITFTLGELHSLTPTMIYNYGNTILNTGIYVGGDKVIHFTCDQENTKSNSVWNLSSSLPLPSSCLNSIDNGFSLHNDKSGHNCDSGSCLCTYSCGFHQSESGVTISCLNCFTGTGSLYLYQYGVSKWTHLSKLRGGISTIEPSDPPQDVVYRTVYLLGEQKGFGDYNVARNNCEDFALYCKTELMIDGKPATGGSGQVNSIVNAPWNPVVVSMLQKAVFSTTSIPVTVAVTVGEYYWKRYKSDIGVRDDVIKVDVKDVGSFRSFRGY